MKPFYLFLILVCITGFWAFGLWFLEKTGIGLSILKEGRGLPTASPKVQIKPGADGKSWYLVWEAPSSGPTPTGYGWKVVDGSGNTLQSSSGNVFQVLLDMTKLQYDTPYNGIVWATNQTGAGPSTTLPFTLYQLPSIVSVTPLKGTFFTSAGGEGGTFFFAAIITLADIVPDLNSIDAEIAYNGKNYPPVLKNFQNVNNKISVAWCDPAFNCSLKVPYATTVTLNVTATNSAGQATYSNNYTSPQSAPYAVSNLSVKYQ